MSTILAIRGLSVGYVGRRATAEAVSDVDLDIAAGEILGVVGESGCGKTTLAIALLGLIEPPGRILAGTAHLTTRDGATLDVLHLSPRQQREIRWKEIAYVPQGSMSALNPVLRVRDQMTDTAIEHSLSKLEVEQRARWALQLVGLDAAILDKYPHELSGGMMQRVTIATAIIMQPSLLVADEPTTALDVVTQRTILQELMKIREKFGTTIVLISHDMAVMAQVADRLAVMYAGHVVEVGAVSQIFDAPMHPYTQKLIDSIPRRTGRRLEGLKGESPSIWRHPPGCRFHPRCSHMMPVCAAQKPDLIEHRAQHWAACHLYPSARIGTNGKADPGVMHG